MTIFRRLFIAALPLAMLIAPASGHHSFAVNFDITGSAELQGTLTDIRVLNPHSLLEIDIVNDDGETESWTVETHSVPLLARVGFTQDTFSPGEEIIVRGWPSRRSSQRLVFGLQFVKADGTVIEWRPDDLVAEGGLARDVENVARIGRERFEAVWGYTADPNPHVVAESPMPLTAAAFEAREAYDAFNTTAMRCIPPNVPGILYVPYLNEIQVEDDSVLIHHEYFGIRRSVPLGDEFVAVEDSGMFGVGRARFDGNNLVVETRGYPDLEAGMATSFDPNGMGADMPSSSQKEITEVYSVSGDGRTLTIDYTITDPVYLTEPWVSSTQMVRLSEGTEIVDFECDAAIAAETSTQQGTE